MGPIIVLLLLVLYYVWYLWSRYPKNFPPHPTFSIPILGDLLLMGDGRMGAFARFRERHGDVFGYLMGSQRTVVLADFDLMLEVGAREDMSGRVVGLLSNKFRHSVDPQDQEKNPGLMFSNGRVWQEQRRFSLQVLKDLGYGKDSNEMLVLEEVEQLCRSIESFNGQPVDMNNRFNISSVNALIMITTGERLKPDDPRLQELVTLLDNAIQQADRPLIQFLIRNRLFNSLVDKVDPKFNAAGFNRVRMMMEGFVKEAKSTYQEDSMRHFIDHFLTMMKVQNSTRDQTSFVGQEGEVNLINDLIDFFVAGSDSTATTLNWAMLYMILNPDVQEKVHGELDEMVGRGVQAKYADRARTPYVEAVLHETQRICNVADRSVPHFARSDCYLSTGHFIPKGTEVIFWLGAVLHDPKEFPNPLKFDPTRFIDENGQFKPSPKVVPFGVGKRRCLGEALSKMELYSFFTGIMARFRVETAHPDDRPTTEPMGTALLKPHPYKLRFILRDQ